MYMYNSLSPPPPPLSLSSSSFLSHSLSLYQVCIPLSTLKRAFFMKEANWKRKRWSELIDKVTKIMK